MTTRFALDSNSLVCEVAANDGYLLRHVQCAGIPCYGIEPTTSTAHAARELGLEIVEEFLVWSWPIDLHPRAAKQI